MEEVEQSLLLRLAKQHAEREGVTEQLKPENPMKWVRRVNNIRERVEEEVGKQIITNPRKIAND